MFTLTKFSVHLTVAVARSSSDSDAVSYVLQL